MNEGSNNTTQETIVKTDTGAVNGQTKCPKCGSSDISLNVNDGKLRCNFCRAEFEAEKLTGMVDDISTLEGDVIASGATQINTNVENLKTLKCTACGAEVVIDTSENTQARCHWCRNFLSINQQVPNGAVPDVVLPFKIKKEDAQNTITMFVKKRRFYANPKFLKEFNLDNIMGVYFPYMIIDINAHGNFKGEGEHEARHYRRTFNDHTEDFYDADVYSVERDFDITINGLTIESSSDKLKNDNSKTNNVINAIMPFDTENCVKFDANFMRGFTSEKRDVDVESLKPVMQVQATDTARFACNKSLEFYDRGVAWRAQNLDIKGTQWKSAYLPVWLYSYLEAKGSKKVLHYVAVNARTSEVMGSVPIHMPKLLIISFLIELLGVFLMFYLDSDYSFMFLSIGIIYFFVIYLKYRNSNARHTYELETKTNVTNLKKVDLFMVQKKGLRNSKIQGCNNTQVNGVKAGSLLDQVANNNPFTGVINEINKGGKK